MATGMHASPCSQYSSVPGAFARTNFAEFILVTRRWRYVEGDHG